MESPILSLPDPKFQLKHSSLTFLHNQEQQLDSSSMQQRKKMVRNATFSSQKSVHNFHRNSRSLKILSTHLRSYKQQIDALSIRKKQHQNIQINSRKLSTGLNIQIKEVHNRKNSKDGDLSKSFKRSQKQSMGRSVSQDQYQKRELIRQAVRVDKGFHQRISELVDNLLMSIKIFSKVFETSKHKRSILSKLYGWDPLFNPIFFTRQGEFYSEELKPNITKNSIITELGLDKYTFSAQNIFNKLRLFLAQLTNKNMNHQQMESKSQKSKLVDSSQKLRNSITKINKQIGTPNLKNSPNQSQQTSSSTAAMSMSNRYLLSQVEHMRQTHNQIFTMKTRIKNRADQIEKLARNTGYVKVNPFYIQEQKNVQRIEQFVQSVAK